MSAIEDDNNQMNDDALAAIGRIYLTNYERYVKGNLSEVQCLEEIEAEITERGFYDETTI